MTYIYIYEKPHWTFVGRFRSAAQTATQTAAQTATQTATQSATQTATQTGTPWNMDWGCTALSTVKRKADKQPRVAPAGLARNMEDSQWTVRRRDPRLPRRGGYLVGGMHVKSVDELNWQTVQLSGT
jgi:hypothetical protein